MGNSKNRRCNKHRRHVFIKPRKSSLQKKQNSSRPPTPPPSSSGARATPPQQSAAQVGVYSSAQQPITQQSASLSTEPSTALSPAPSTPSLQYLTPIGSLTCISTPVTPILPLTCTSTPPSAQLPPTIWFNQQLIPVPVVPSSTTPTNLAPSTLTPSLQSPTPILPLTCTSTPTSTQLPPTICFNPQLTPVPVVPSSISPTNLSTLQPVTPPFLPISFQSSQTWSNSSHSQSTTQQIDIEGSRIINIHQLQLYITQLGQHYARCGGEVKVMGEVRQGLASILYTECIVCGHKIQLETSEKVRGPRGCMRWETNLAAVWGQMVTGGGHATLQETMSVLGVPTMTKKAFVRTERDIGEWWKLMLEEEMVRAGKEEKRLAEERNDFHQGVPAVTVIVDGGWSKRSHKHSYNAKSGVAVIFGLKTGKILHIGVRNKYCTACALGISPDKHACFKNWEDSSSEMETDIIVDGFQQAESKHGVRYMRFIGDGDSSVHPALLEGVSVWGQDIKKIECANHACKCYRGSLEKLASDNPGYKGKGGLTLKMRKRLTSAARCAIKMRSQEEDRHKAVRLLEQDLVNGPLHCFGYHQKCSPDFCKIARQRVNGNSDPGLQKGRQENREEDREEIRMDEERRQGGEGSDLNGDEQSVSYDGDLQSVLHSTIEEQTQQQSLLWSEVMNDDEESQANATPVSKELMHDIQVILSRLVAKAPQLIGNFTTNLAESWMHVRSKFDGGKVINRSQSGSWGHRCMGAGLRHNVGLQWGPKMYTCMTGEENLVYTETAELTAKKASKDRKRKATNVAKENRRKSKYSKTDNSIAARKAYSRHEGIQPDEASQDISEEHLEELKDSFYTTKVSLTSDEARDLELQTRNQADSALWIQERKKRITASNVGGLCKMMKKTKRSTKVKTLLYSRFKGNIATQYGKRREENSRQKYIAYQRSHGHPNLTTQATGLVVSHHAPWLGASPDDRVVDPDSTIPNGLAEYKNPYTAREFTISEACEKLPSFCLEKHNPVNQAASYRLKKRHNYYYQVQCQLFCDEKKWCDFVVNTEKDIHIERIYFDQKWWDQQCSKLHTFYFKALLPELACPRHYSGGIREPTESE